MIKTEELEYSYVQKVENSRGGIVWTCFFLTSFQAMNQNRTDWLVGWLEFRLGLVGGLVDYGWYTYEYFFVLIAWNEPVPICSIVLYTC